MEEDEFIDPDNVNNENEEGPTPLPFERNRTEMEPEEVEMGATVEINQTNREGQEDIITRWRNRMMDRGIREDIPPPDADEIVSEGSYFTTLIDRYVNKRHCPYCFEFVVKRIYRDQRHSSIG